MSFQQAAIKVEKAQEFARLQAAVEHAFLPEKAESFLKRLDRKGIRVRDFDAVLAQRILESVGESGLDARQLYESLPVSDQAQMRDNTIRNHQFRNGRDGIHRRIPPDVKVTQTSGGDFPSMKKAVSEPGAAPLRLLQGCGFSDPLHP